MNYTRLTRPIASSKPNIEFSFTKSAGKESEKWGVGLEQFKSYGAQGGTLTRLLSAKGAQRSHAAAAPRRPASAKYVGESRQPGQSFSRTGQHSGTLDKTSVIHAILTPDSRHSNAIQRCFRCCV